METSKQVMTGEELAIRVKLENEAARIARLQQEIAALDFMIEQYSDKGATDENTR